MTRVFILIRVKLLIFTQIREKIADFNRKPSKSSNFYTHFHENSFFPEKH